MVNGCIVVDSYECLLSNCVWKALRISFVRENTHCVKAACEIVYWGGGHCNIRRLSDIFWSDREHYVFPDSA